MSNGILLVGRATRTGLGYMTLDFHREIKPERTVIIDTGNLPLDLLPEFQGDCPPIFRIISIWAWRAGESLARLSLAGMRSAVGFETWYRDDFPDIARGAGVRTIGFPMWECSPASFSKSDVLIATSTKDEREYAGLGKTVYHPWPVAIGPGGIRVTPPGSWPPRVFVHNAGHLGGNGRNNTREVMAAAKYLEGTRAKLYVRSQEPLPREWFNDCVEQVEAAADRSTLYARADVIVHPQGIEGLSLPLNEAAVARVPTIVMDLPQWRDAGWPYLIPARPGGTVRFARRVEIYRPDVESLGEFMRAMALGRVERKLPPATTGWEGFSERMGMNVS